MTSCIRNPRVARTHARAELLESPATEVGDPEAGPQLGNLLLALCRLAAESLACVELVPRERGGRAQITLNYNGSLARCGGGGTKRF